MGSLGDLLVKPKTRRTLLIWTLVADLVFLVVVTAWVVFFQGRGLLLWLAVYFLLVGVHLLLLLQRGPVRRVKVVHNESSPTRGTPRTVIRRGES